MKGSGGYYDLVKLFQALSKVEVVLVVVNIMWL
jgi:hypothetical protein